MERTFEGGARIGGRQTASEHFATEKWAIPHGFVYGSTTILRMRVVSFAPPKAERLIW
jgi:hypothetical protein